MQFFATQAILLPRLTSTWTTTRWSTTITTRCSVGGAASTVLDAHDCMGEKVSNRKKKLISYKSHKYSINYYLEKYIGGGGDGSGGGGRTHAQKLDQHVVVQNNFFFLERTQQQQQIWYNITKIPKRVNIRISTTSTTTCTRLCHTTGGSPKSVIVGGWVCTWPG